MKKIVLNGSVDLWNLLIGIKKEHRLVLVLMGIWGMVTRFWSSPEMTVGINESVPLMVVLGLISFLILLELVWWLLNRFWLRLGLPGLEVLVIYYRRMEVWQQVMFYWASFALLLLAGVGCLTTVL
ncbi:MAG: hypothetical protein V4594_08665 [Bacteroidota bacterium]